MNLSTKTILFNKDRPHVVQQLLRNSPYSLLCSLSLLRKQESTVARIAKETIVNRLKSCHFDEAIVVKQTNLDGSVQLLCHLLGSRWTQIELSFNISRDYCMDWEEIFTFFPSLTRLQKLTIDVDTFRLSSLRSLTLLTFPLTIRLLIVVDVGFCEKSIIRIVVFLLFSVALALFPLFLRLQQNILQPLDLTIRSRGFSSNQLSSEFFRNEHVIALRSFSFNGSIASSESLSEICCLPCRIVATSSTTNEGLTMAKMRLKNISFGHFSLGSLFIHNIANLIGILERERCFPGEEIVHSSVEISPLQKEFCVSTVVDGRFVSCLLRVYYNIHGRFLSIQTYAIVRI